MNLHSTVVLLKQYKLIEDNPTLDYLHSTVVLLKLYCLDNLKLFLKHLHSTVVLLKLCIIFYTAFVGGIYILL